MRISDWSSDVCSSDLIHAAVRRIHAPGGGGMQRQQPGEQREGKRSWQQQPDTLALFQPEVWQIAADDLRYRGNDEQAKRIQHAKPVMRRSVRSSRHGPDAG